VGRTVCPEAHALSARRDGKNHIVVQKQDQRWQAKNVDRGTTKDVSQPTYRHREGEVGNDVDSSLRNIKPETGQDEMTIADRQADR